MKKIIHKISQVIQVILLAPVKLPGKVMNILKYVAVGLGVVDTVLSEEEESSAPPEQEGEEEEGGGEAAD